MVLPFPSLVGSGVTSALGAKVLSGGGGEGGFPGGSVGRESACNAGNSGDVGSVPEWGGVAGWKIPWRRAWQPAPVFLTGESHGQRSLAATVHGVAKSRTQLKRLSTRAHAQWTGGNDTWVSFLCLCLFKISPPFSIQHICFGVPENPILWGYQM